MRPLPQHLVNTPHIEIWPAHLLRARSNRDARLLACARHVLRAKRDGRFLAASGDDGLRLMADRADRTPGWTAALGALQAASRRPARVRPLALEPLERRLAQLGLDASYDRRTGLARIAEPGLLDYAGRDRFGRPLWLLPDAARAWQRMRTAAYRDDVVLEAISGYRSHDYQLGIFERKLARGQTVEQILTVNAAPGYSQHHSGRALDISAPGEPAAEERFELTAAFAWLRDNAAAHGFVMSYPRDNPHGIVYEPWHWYHDPVEARA
jgi:D-alanyl-D-alanine carboxypeptidase